MAKRFLLLTLKTEDSYVSWNPTYTILLDEKEKSVVDVLIEENEHKKVTLINQIEISESDYEDWIEFRTKKNKEESDEEEEGWSEY